MILNCSLENNQEIAVTGIVVTYGNRSDYVLRTVRQLLFSGVTRVVLVNNGSKFNYDDAFSDVVDNLVFIVKMERNFGSAVGFKVGIQRALDFGDGLVIFMDDDNFIEKDGFDILKKEWIRLCSGGEKNFAVLGARPGHGYHLAQLMISGRYKYRKNSVMGFNIFEAPVKIWEKIILNKISHDDEFNLSDRVLVPYAPYGGLLMHSDLIKKIGFPRDDFVLYQDDTEFTSRIAGIGGGIVFVPAAKVTDLDPSWTDGQAANRNMFINLILGNGNFRLYYTVRNHIYIDYKRRMNSWPIFFLNLLIFFTVLHIVGVYRLEFNRLSLLRYAIKDGIFSRLGECKKFRLPV